MDDSVALCGCVCKIAAMRPLDPHFCLEIAKQFGFKTPVLSRNLLGEAEDHKNAPRNPRSQDLINGGR